jgi:hypothetical protein
MIRLQHKSINPTARLGSILSQSIQIAAIVLIGKEARLAVMTSLNEINGNI